jgi:hypothetical protein
MQQQLVPWDHADLELVPFRNIHELEAIKETTVIDIPGTHHYLV